MVFDLCLQPAKGILVTIFDVITERKQAEEACGTGRPNIGPAVETSVDGFCITDMTGRFLEFNDAYAGLWASAARNCSA